MPSMQNSHAGNPPSLPYHQIDVDRLIAEAIVGVEGDLDQLVAAANYFFLVKGHIFVAVLLK